MCNTQSLRRELRDWQKLVDEFAKQQEPLGEEFQKVLDENRWELYEGKDRRGETQGKRLERDRQDDAGLHDSSERGGTDIPSIED